MSDNSGGGIVDNIIAKTQVPANFNTGSSHTVSNRYTDDLGLSPVN